MNMPRHIKGLEDVAAQYDGFILDLWGVVHDGINPFPTTIPALKELRRARRRVYMLSNAPRRAELVAIKLKEMGVTPDLYDGIVTSGEATHHALRDKYLASWGRKCFHMGAAARDGSIYGDLDVQIVKTPEEADFVLNSGIETFADTADQYRPLLAACRAKNLPMICANPDRVVHIEDQLVICAGALADIYVEMGGTVEWFGKPYRDVYKLCLAGLGLEAGRVLAVGDGMPTDIEGANGQGMDSALVISGIHRDHFGENHSPRFFEDYPFKPTYLLNKFSW